jgi:hypothetical protein
MAGRLGLQVATATQWRAKSGGTRLVTEVAPVAPAHLDGRVVVVVVRAVHSSLARASSSV